VSTATGYSTNAFQLPGSFAATSLEDGGRRENSDRERADVRSALGYRPSSGISIATEWFTGAGSYGIPPGTIADASDIFAQTPRFERVEDYRVSSGQVSVVIAPSQRFNLHAWVFRNSQRENRARYDDATYSSMDDPVVQGTFQSQERTTVTGSSALARLDLERFGWVRLAVNQRREVLDSDGVIRDVPIAGRGSGAGGGSGRTRATTFDVRSFAIDRHVNVYSTGAEWQVHWMERLGTVIGAAANVQQRPGGETETEPTWLAGVSFKASDPLRLRASAARKVRMPSIDQLFNTSFGNPALRSERVNSVDVGADYQLATASTVSVSAFTTDAHGFIERISDSAFANQDRYRFRGAEITVDTSRIPRLNLRGSYSFLDSVSISPGVTRPLQTRPRHRGSLEWIWMPVRTSTLRGAAYRTGSQLYDARGAAVVQRTAEAFTLVDVGFTQTLAPRFEVAFDVTNLFDRLYEQAYGLPREGRTAILTLRVRATGGSAQSK
jgi:outer membrane receptor protein involved in Fe transport